ncbi:GNAT family N-acetyltransferase [Clostridium niameyense]|uniref:GNAT family N-acetyltransferase n=1 Tax=Clostridium niameyense TaxID=1622073 RepID=A0A6M0R7B0_9CLOT|nr:GNAT family protein [Clostridium niameyense]NEZ46112.1 GNAT family N-acetyltransferase [Clostridium niameyense]
MKNMLLKNGTEVIIRKAEKKDAQNMINFYNVVGGETTFLSFGKNEFKMPLNDYENFIESTNAEKNSIVLVATINDEIISIATVESPQKAKGRHVGEFGIVISQKYCGLGLGTELMTILIEWAKSNGITKKISLVTNETNSTAIKLYKNLGFEEEGILRNECFIDGVYSNLIYMGLLL